MSIIASIIVAISLSMDAFGFAVLYGTREHDKKEQVLISAIVGIFHFFMPILGVTLGNSFNNIFASDNVVVFIIFTFIAAEMIISTFKVEKKYKFYSLIDYFLFGLAVSIDSFSLGIGLSFYNNYIFSCMIFMAVSFLFTLLGLKMGSLLNEKVGRLSTLFGGMLLFIVGILFLVDIF